MSLDLETTVKQWIDADPESDLTAYLEVPADRPQPAGFAQIPHFL